MELSIVKKLCSANQHDGASLIKELVKNMEEISKLAHSELVKNRATDDEVLKHIKSLARDSIEHAKSK